jgi:tRNA (Thr-GGU) A37 N-methylase
MAQATSVRPIGYVRSPYSEMSQIPKGCGAQHKAGGVLELLFDPATQARLRALPTRVDRLEALTTEIEKELAASVAERKAMQPHFWCR